jgi:sialic acid synthase
MKKNEEVYIVAEVGHNHKGSIEEAKKLFLAAKTAGANAVKLQKRDNKSLYTKKFYNQIYDNPNSYGETYGKHREVLEFDFDQYKELQNYAKSIKIDFFATPFDINSVNFLKKLNMPAYKLASADLTNSPLQEAVAKLSKPIFLSTGGGTMDDIKRAADIILKHNNNLTILHCTASYPASIHDMNLSVITTLKKEFKDLRIGLSDHENGIDAGVVAYMLGARTFEKHFTLDRGQKGTDHSFSLETVGLQKFVRNVKRVDIMLGSETKKLLENEKKPLFKMKKSIVAKKDLKANHVINFEDLSFKSPGGGLEPYMYVKIVGKKLKKDIKEEDLILLGNLE